MPSISSLKLFNLNAFVFIVLLILFTLLPSRGSRAAKPEDICADISATEFYESCMQSTVVKHKGFIPSHLRPPWLDGTQLFRDNELSRDEASGDRCYACYKGATASKGIVPGEEYCACLYKNPNEEFEKMFGNLDKMTCVEDFHKIALMQRCGNKHYDSVKHCAMVHFYDNDPKKDPNGYENRRTLVFLDGCIVVSGQKDTKCTAATVKMEFDQSGTSFFGGSCDAEKKTVFESTIDLMASSPTSFTFPVEFSRRLCTGLSGTAENDETFNGITLTINGGDCGTKSFQLPTIDPEKARVQEMRGLQLNLGTAEDQPTALQWRASDGDGNFLYTAQPQLSWQPTQLDTIDANGIVDSALLYPTDAAAEAKAEEQSQQKQETMAKLLVQPEFSMKLLTMVYHNKSTVVSPISMAIAMGMAFAGANEQTEAEFDEVLLVNWSDPSSVHHKIGTLLNVFKSADPTTFIMSPVNKIYLEKTLEVLDTFKSTISDNYGTDLGFFSQKDTKKAAKDINAFVEHATNGAIKDIVQSPALISNSDRFLLISAMHLNAQWFEQFDKKDTKNGQFHMANGKDIELPMMSQQNNFIYKEEVNFKLLGMDYVDNSAQLVIVLPNANDGIGTLLSELTEAKLMALVQKNSAKTKVQVVLPTFKIESTHNLEDILPLLGLTNAADVTSADFSALTTTGGQLRIDKFLQKAQISANEFGTESAVASNVLIIGIEPPEALAPPVPTFSADHPFAFFVVHDKRHLMISGVFMGEQ